MSNIISNNSKQNDNNLIDNSAKNKQILISINDVEEFLHKGTGKIKDNALDLDNVLQDYIYNNKQINTDLNWFQLEPTFKSNDEYIQLDRFVNLYKAAFTKKLADKELAVINYYLGNLCYQNKNNMPIYKFYKDVHGNKNNSGMLFVSTVDYYVYMEYFAKLNIDEDFAIEKEFLQTAIDYDKNNNKAKLLLDKLSTPAEKKNRIINILIETLEKDDEILELIEICKSGNKKAFDDFFKNDHTKTFDETFTYMLNKFDYTNLLSIAILHDNTEIAFELIDLGFDPNKTDGYGSTPLTLVDLLPKKDLELKELHEEYNKRYNDYIKTKQSTKIDNFIKICQKDTFDDFTKLIKKYIYIKDVIDIVTEKSKLNMFSLYKILDKSGAIEELKQHTIDTLSKKFKQAIELEESIDNSKSRNNSRDNRIEQFIFKLKKFIEICQSGTKADLNDFFALDTKDVVDKTTFTYQFNKFDFIDVLSIAILSNNLGIATQLVEYGLDYNKLDSNRITPLKLTEWLYGGTRKLLQKTFSAYEISERYKLNSLISDIKHGKYIEEAFNNFKEKLKKYVYIKDVINMGDYKNLFLLNAAQDSSQFEIFNDLLYMGASPFQIVRDHTLLYSACLLGQESIVETLVQIPNMYLLPEEKERLNITDKSNVNYVDLTDEIKELIREVPVRTEQHIHLSQNIHNNTIVNISPNFTNSIASKIKAKRELLDKLILNKEETIARLKQHTIDTLSKAFKQAIELEEPIDNSKSESNSRDNRVEQFVLKLKKFIGICQSGTKADLNNFFALDTKDVVDKTTFTYQFNKFDFINVLSIAILSDNLEIATQLIEYGLDYNKLDSNGITPLKLFYSKTKKLPQKIFSRDETLKKEKLQDLLLKINDVNRFRPINHKHAEEAFNDFKGKIKKYIYIKDVIDMKDSRHDSLLMSTCEDLHSRIFNDLLYMGADPFIIDKFGSTLLYCACLREQKIIIGALLKSPNMSLLPKEKEKLSITEETHRSYVKIPDEIRKLISELPVRTERKIVNTNNKTEQSICLPKNPVNNTTIVNIFSNSTNLISSKEKVEPELIDKLILNKEETIARLKQHTIDTLSKAFKQAIEFEEPIDNSKSENNSRDNRIEQFIFKLKKFIEICQSGTKADLNKFFTLDTRDVVDKTTFTYQFNKFDFINALSIAILSNNLEIATQLVEYGLDYNKFDSHGITPLKLTERIYGETKNLPQKKSEAYEELKRTKLSKFHSICVDGKYDDFVELLKKYIYIKDIIDVEIRKVQFYRSPLSFAIIKNRSDLRMFNDLLYMGANPNQADCLKRTTLNWACFLNLADAVKSLLTLPNIDLKVEHCGKIKNINDDSLGFSDEIKKLVSKSKVPGRIEQIINTNNFNNKEEKNSEPKALDHEEINKKLIAKVEQDRTNKQRLSEKEKQLRFDSLKSLIEKFNCKESNISEGTISASVLKNKISALTAIAGIYYDYIAILNDKLFSLKRLTLLLKITENIHFAYFNTICNIIVQIKDSIHRKIELFEKEIIKNQLSLETVLDSKEMDIAISKLRYIYNITSDTKKGIMNDGIANISRSIGQYYEGCKVAAYSVANINQIKYHENYDDIKETFLKVKEDDRNYYNAQFYLGFMYKGKNLQEKAIKCFLNCSNNYNQPNKQYSKCNFYLGIIYEEQKKYDEALKYLLIAFFNNGIDKAGYELKGFLNNAKNISINSNLINRVINDLENKNIIKKDFLPKETKALIKAINKELILRGDKNLVIDHENSTDKYNEPSYFFKETFQVLFENYIKDYKNKTKKALQEEICKDIFTDSNICNEIGFKYK